MTSHNLLVAVFTVSCVTLSAGNLDNTTTRTYPTRVLNSAPGECPSDAQREMVIAEVKEDIRNLLPLIRKWLHLMCKLLNADSIYSLMVHCMGDNFTCPGKISDVPHIVRQQKFEATIKYRILQYTRQLCCYRVALTVLVGLGEL